MKTCVNLVGFLFGAVLLCATARAANNATNSGHGHTTTVSVTYNATTGKVNWLHTWTRASVSSGGPAAWIYTTTGDGGGYGTSKHDHGGIGTGTGADSGEFTAAVGDWLRLGARIVGTDGSVSDVHEYWQVPASAPGNATKHKSKLVEFKNTTDYKLLYVVKDAAGVVKDRFYVNPGETYYRQFQRDSTDTGQWTITPNIVGATMNGDGQMSYTGNNSDTVEMLASDFIPSTDFTTGSNPGIGSTSVTAPTIAINPSAPPPAPSVPGGPKENRQYRGSVVYSGTSGAADADALRTGDFKEGADQIVGELKKANETLETAEARHVEGQKLADSQKTTGKATADTKAAEAKAAFESAVPSQSTIGTGASQSSSLFSLAIPKGNGAHRAVNLDPNVVDGIDDVLPWIRSVIALFVAGWFTWWAYGELSIFIMGMQALQPARGNTIAGSGGQATSLIVAGWTTLIVTAAPTAIVALWTGAPLLSTVGGGTIDLFGGAPSGAAQAGVYLIYSLLPMATIATALTSMFVIRKAGPAIYMGVAAAVRWCVA